MRGKGSSGFTFGLTKVVSIEGATACGASSFTEAISVPSVFGISEAEEVSTRAQTGTGWELRGRVATQTRPNPREAAAMAPVVCATDERPDVSVLTSVGRVEVIASGTEDGITETGEERVRRALIDCFVPLRALRTVEGRRACATRRRCSEKSIVFYFYSGVEMRQKNPGPRCTVWRVCVGR